MKRTLSLLIMSLLLGGSCSSPVKKKDIKSPDEQYPELFAAVQLSGLFPDSKTFVDAVPRGKTEEIAAAYAAEKTKPGFNLKSFITSHFDFPAPAASEFKADTSRTLQQHINALWPVLTREPRADGGSLIPLRKPYVVPGGRFGEIYYWDSYFTMLGLRASGKTSLLEGMVVNFAQLIQDFGHIPNGNRSYYLSRSQPPFFSLMVKLLAETTQNKKVLEDALPQLQKEYQYWMSVENDDAIAKQNEAKKRGETAHRKAVFVGPDQILNRYFDAKDTPRPEAYKEDIETAKQSGRRAAEVYRHLRSGAESGWDYTSRWLRDGQTLATIHTTDIVPVDLNALLYYLERTLEETYRQKGLTNYADSMKKLAEKRIATLNQYCWNAADGFYYDYDFVAKKQTGVPSLAAVYPLFFKMATPEQAKAVAAKLDKEFLQPGGLPATLGKTGQQWDAPNGWAPLQYLAIVGLRNYGHTALADEIKQRWIANNLRVYKATGKLVEKYNVYDINLPGGGGEYKLQDGFGWTNGVLLALLAEKSAAR